MGIWEYSDIIGYSILLIYIYVYICIGNMVLLHLTSKLVPGSKHNIYIYIDMIIYFPYSIGHPFDACISSC